MAAEKDNSIKNTEPKKRKKRWGDRKEGRRLRTITPMLAMTPFIMKDRNDALNMFADSVDIEPIEAVIKDLRDQGYKNMGILHCLIASYVRIVALRPAVNRFISGQRVYARNDIEIVMTIKKEMSLSSPDTVIKVKFDPEDTLIDVYEKFNKAVEDYRNAPEDSSFDKLAGVLSIIPRPILRGVVKLLYWLDYHGWLPQFILDLSPFHGSMIITSMGSLGIQPIYHHIYNFGNLPVFICYGKRQRRQVLNEDGSVSVKPFIDMTVVTDERICDGYYYAAAFKQMQRIFRNPTCLLTPPEEVIPDID